MKALEHRQKIELRELNASQKARLREWEAGEKTAIQTYLKAKHSGKEIRSYTQDRATRHGVLLSMQAEERKQRANEQDVRRRALFDEQSLNLKESKQFLSKGERPPDKLWPQPGH